MTKKADQAAVVGEVADQVIQKYKADPFERLRMIYRVELRPFQWEWWFLMDQHPDILCKSCPRVGKTVAISIKDLDDAVINPDEEVMIFNPKYDQSVNSFKPAFDIIDRSPVLQAYLRRSVAGKPEFGKGFVEFINRSTMKCFGVGSNFEGENATVLHVDELDDVPSETLKRVFGRSIGKNKNGFPTRKRLSGVIWGKLNIYQFDEDPGFYTLPALDVYAALANGYLDEKAVKDERSQMTDEEWLRTMCLQYVESRNLIWEIWLKLSQYIGLQWKLMPVAPIEGHTFNKSGKVGFGLDMGHQGGGDDASDYSLQVVESVGSVRRWLWGRVWPPDAHPADIMADVTEAWRFFRPDMAYGDALDANLCAQTNDMLYDEGLVRYRWSAKGRNQAEGWSEWAKHGLLTPIHNSGRTKHYMYKSLRNAIFGCMKVGTDEAGGNIFVFPMLDRDKALKKLPSWMELRQLLRELANLTSERMPSGYLKIERHKKKIDDTELDFEGDLKLGDDRPDALAMANYALDFLEARRSHGAEVKLEYVSGF